MRNPINLLDSTGTASAKAQSIAKVAVDQFNRFNGIDEGAAPLRPQIVKYWTEIGLNFPGVETAWSAVFVSWCVKKGGLTSSEFKTNSNHSLFVHDCLHNDRAYKVMKVAEYAPRVGDIIHHNRNGSSRTLEDMANPGGFGGFASHSAIVVQKGEDGRGKFVMTIGGNESDTVGRVRWALNANGTLKQRTNNPIICVLRLTI